MFACPVAAPPFPPSLRPRAPPCPCAASPVQHHTLKASSRNPKSPAPFLHFSYASFLTRSPAASPALHQILSESSKTRSQRPQLTWSMLPSLIFPVAPPPTSRHTPITH